MPYYVCTVAMQRGAVVSCAGGDRSLAVVVDCSLSLDHSTLCGSGRHVGREPSVQ